MVVVSIYTFVTKVGNVKERSIRQQQWKILKSLCRLLSSSLIF